MDFKTAKNKLSTYIENMKLEDSNISYAAIVVKEGTIDNYVIEYGTYDLGGRFYFEGDLTPAQLKDFEINKSLGYKVNDIKDNFRKAKKTTSVTGDLLISKNEVLEKFRPLRAATSVSDITSAYKSGTLGAFFRIQDDTNLYAISNMHVLSYFEEENNPGKPTLSQELIVQPSRLDAAKLFYGHKPFIIGNTVWKKFDGLIDAAIARIQSGLVCNGRFFNGKNRIFYNQNQNIKEGQVVHKYGRSSGYTDSTILSTSAAIRIENIYSSINNLPKIIVFTDQIMTDDMALPGDSGSILCDGYDNALGLTFADVTFKSKLLEDSISLLSNNNSLPKGRTFHNKLSNIIPNIQNENGKPLTFKEFVTH